MKKQDKSKLLVIENSQTVEVTKFIGESNLAYHFDCEGDRVWLPKSMVNWFPDKMEVEMSDWMFKQKFPDG